LTSLDRFSRDAGEAMNMVKQFQKNTHPNYQCDRRDSLDYDTPEVFRAGFTMLHEEDNINRSIKARGGLYTARAKEGS
jgi:DNA invertase Pin-like site-specific DNA recombinase